MIGRRVHYFQQTDPAGNEALQPPGTIVAIHNNYVTIERDDGTLAHIHFNMLLSLEPLPPAARDAEAALEQAMLACAHALEAVRRGQNGR